MMVDGHYISGIYIDTTESYQGLFGYCSGTIKNLGIKNSKVVSTQNYIGGIAGWAQTVENCSNSGEISGYVNVGGIVGYSGTNITKCYNSGKICNNANLSYTAQLGGVVGYANQVSYCYNSGPIIALIRCDNIGGVARLSYNNDFFFIQCWKY